MSTSDLKRCEATPKALFASLKNANKSFGFALQGAAAETSTKNMWVVFSGKADCAWLKCLKPGFRHCFAIINDGQRWLSFDPMLNYTDVQMHHHIPPTFDLPNWFARRGYRVLKAPLCKKPARPAPLAPFSCVECVKRLLGLHRRFIFTPWQLYRHLLKHQ